MSQPSLAILRTGLGNGSYRAVSHEPPRPIATKFNEDESKVGAYTLPDALLCDDGSRVKDVQTWQTKRRGEILRSFATHMYGVTPGPPPQVRGEITARRADAVDGLATRTLITLQCFDDPAAPCIHLMLYVPNSAAKPRSGVSRSELLGQRKRGG